MRRFRALLKVLLISYFGLAAFRVQTAEDRRVYLKKLGMALLVVVALAPTMVLYTNILIKGYEALLPLGQQGAIISFGIVMVSALIFFFGIFYVINFFYLAEDTQNFLALPLSGWQVLGARYSVMLGYEYLTALPFVLPPLLVYGIKDGASVIYWIYAFIAFILIPLLPLSLATIPTVVVMRFANLGKRKDLLKILGGLAVIAAAVAYQFVFQKSGPEFTDPVFLQNLLTDRNGLMNLLSRIFPSTQYIALALVESDKVLGLIKLLEFVALSIGAVALAWLVGEKLYFPGLIGAGETSTRRRKLNQSDYRRIGQARSARLAYLYKEIRLLMRTPTYFLNCVLTNFLVPVLMIIPLLLQKHNTPASVPWESLAAGAQGQIILLAAVVGLTVFLAGTNGITATSLSREGQELYISKFIPISYRQQMQAKLLSALVFGVIGALLIIIAAYIMIPFSINLAGILLLECLVAVVPVIEAGLLIDILRPKLKWENEQQAVKQNLNILFSMLLALLLGGAVIYPIIRYMHSLAYAAGFMLLCFGLLALGLYYLLMTWGVQRYQELEG